MTGDTVARLLGAGLGWALPFVVVFGLAALFGLGFALAVCIAFVGGLRLGMWVKERADR